MNYKEKIKDYYGVEPTDEQLKIIETVINEENVIVQAGAGTSKTTTMKFIRLCHPSPKAIYLAYNKVLVDEAVEEFNNEEFGDITVKTFNGAVFSFFMSMYGDAFINKGTSGKFAFITPSPKFIKSYFKLQSDKVAVYIYESLCKYYDSDDMNVSEKHLSKSFFDDKDVDILTELMSLTAEERVTKEKEIKKKWNKIYSLYSMEIMSKVNIISSSQMNMKCKKFNICHSSYLKMFHIQGYQLSGYDQFFIDEAQDLNGVQVGILKNQNKDVQYIVVGDIYQTIYRWRGAKGDLDFINGTKLTLSNSFRCPHHVADYANQILDISYSDRTFKLVGLGKSDEVEKSAKIFRTNVGIFTEAIKLVEDENDFHTFDPRKTLISALKNMRNFIIGSSDNNVPYNTPKELDKAIEERLETSRELIMTYSLFKKKGVKKMEKLINYLEVNHGKNKGICLLTAHGSKGLEFDTVYIGDDFLADTKDGKVMRGGDEEINLLYVAVTRTKNVLSVPETLKKEIRTKREV